MEIVNHYVVHQGFPDSSVGKESACNARDPGSIPGLGISTGKGISYPLQYTWASLVAQLVTESICNAGDLCWISRLGRFPGEGNSYPHQNSMDRVAWQAPVQRVPQSWTPLSDVQEKKIYQYWVFQSMNAIFLRLFRSSIFFFKYLIILSVGGLPSG